MPQAIAQTNFNGGEISPRLAGRPDLAAYQIGLSECRNFVPLLQGPVTKRPGTIHAELAKVQGEASRLIPFVPRSTQAYVIEASSGTFRYFTNNAPLETSPGVPLETPTPYTAADIARLNWHQSNDVLYLVDGRQQQRQLRRLTATTFSLGALVLRGGPFKDQNRDKAVTISASAATGNINLVATQPIFQAGLVGSLIELEAIDFRSIRAWEPAAQVNVGDLRRSDGKVYRCIARATSGRTGSVQPTHSEGQEWDGTAFGIDINQKDALGVLWEYVHGRFGIARITAFISSFTVQATVEQRLPDDVTGSGSTWRWALSAYSDVEGWPQTVTVWNERLILTRGNRIDASVVGDFTNFARRTDAGLLAPDQAFTYRLPQAGEILWTEADRQLLLGTATAEYAISAVNQAAAVSATNIAAPRQSQYGSKAVRVLGAGTRTLFVQRGGRKLRQMGYSFQDDRYVSPDLTVRAQHVTRSGITAMALQNEPEALIWCTRGDGQLLTLTFAEDEQVRGWAVMPLGGTQAAVESLCVVPAPDNSFDQLWLQTRRTVGGQVQRAIEYLAPFRDEADALADAYFVDAGLTYRGVPAGTFSNLGHLAGEAVMVLADGAVIGPLTVSGGGSITLPEGRTASVVHVGLAYTARIKTMQLDPPAAEGSSQGRLKRAVRAVLRLLDTVQVKMAAMGGRMDDVTRRPQSIPLGQAVPAFTGDIQIGVDGPHEARGVLVMESAEPLPATILAVFPAFDVGAP